MVGRYECTWGPKSTVHKAPHTSHVYTEQRERGIPEGKGIYIRPNSPDFGLVVSRVKSHTQTIRLHTLATCDMTQGLTRFLSK